jgi:hypothetical protein
VKLTKEATGYRKGQNRYLKIGVRNMRIVTSTPIICSGERFQTVVCSSYIAASETCPFLSLLSAADFVVSFFLEYSADPNWSCKMVKDCGCNWLNNESNQNTLGGTKLIPLPCSLTLDTYWWTDRTILATGYQTIRPHSHTFAINYS